MQKSTLLSAALSAMVALGIGLTSCKDDDDPFVPPTVSVGTKTVTVLEGAGSTSVEIVLNTPAASALTIEYSLGGTATSPADYSIVGREGEVQIAQGATSGTIEIEIVDDAIFEGNETIVITLEDVTGGDATITNEDEAVVTIEENDQQVVASFATSTLTVIESENEELLELEVTLDKSATQDITIKYAFRNDDADALDSTFAYNEEIPPQYYDFFVEGGAYEVVIPAGSQSAKIQIQVLSDFLFEDDEEFQITLTEATGATIGTNNTVTVTINQEDGRIIALVWDDYQDVDMDFFLWIGPEIDELFLAAASTNPNAQQFEVLFIPAGISDAAFGTSYVYYGGTEEPMNFEAQFIDFADGGAEPEEEFDIYPGTYTLANINKWDTDAGTQPAIAQTFRKVAGEFVDITDPIVIPESGSRMVTVALPSGVKKMPLKSSRANKVLR